MSNITLTRVTKPRVDCSDGTYRVKETVETLFVKFARDDGCSVSLAFDGRPHIAGYPGSPSRRIEIYSVLPGCPVQSDKQMRPGSDLQTMRFLRDALTAMDLGDYDASVVCCECGRKYIPDDSSSCTFCEDCTE